MSPIKNLLQIKYLSQIKYLLVIISLSERSVLWLGAIKYFIRSFKKCFTFQDFYFYFFISWSVNQSHLIAWSGQISCLFSWSYYIMSWSADQISWSGPEYFFLIFFQYFLLADQISKSARSHQMIRTNQKII